MQDAACCSGPIWMRCPSRRRTPCPIARSSRGKCMPAAMTGTSRSASRRRDPLSEVVVSVTEVHAGRAFNVIPDRTQLRGTVRTFGGHFFEDAPRLVDETAGGVAAAFGAEASVVYRRLSAPLSNNEE